ncbi:hypothetical protein [Comamonas antarctica]|uniref:hypothetical protein n=1 Tax=Comamonas antarctica TaxID=2743470 RepID=UPI0028EE28EA|nr:hypothetical protein [Comamonas antarctica]
MSQPIEDVATLRRYIKSLNKAIAVGARSVTLGSQTVIYNTTESLIMARDDMQKQLNAALSSAPGSTRVSRQAYAVYGGRDF